MSDLSALADRCENATSGPTNDDLFEEAFRLCFPVPKQVWGDGKAYIEWSPEYTAWHAQQIAFNEFLNARAYLDAALTLVPEDMRDEIEITTLYRVARVGINLNHGPDGGPFYGENVCNSIPLALCAAALRARAQGDVS